jgi:hypothetical protein
MFQVRCFAVSNHELYCDSVSSDTGVEIYVRAYVEDILEQVISKMVLLSKTHLGTYVWVADGRSKQWVRLIGVQHKVKKVASDSQLPSSSKVR